jgi:hypothetical protein
MKTIIIREVLNFERGKDPKKSMDIGFFIKRDFNNLNEAIEWIYNHLSAILKTDKIPEDIIMGEERKAAHIKTYLYFKEKYIYEIEDYIDEYLTINNNKIDWIELLWKKLSNVGFKTLLKLDESIHFNREGSTFNKIDIGKKYSDEKFIEETDWVFNIKYIHEKYNIIELIRNYKGFPILILEFKDTYLNKIKYNTNKKYTAISSDDQLDSHFSEPITALEEMQEIIDNKIKNKI